MVEPERALRVRAVSVDFDDTLIRSEAVKRRVLEAVAASVPGGAAALEGVRTDARVAGAKVTRYTIFRDLGMALGVADAETFGRRLADEYSARVAEALESAEEVRGAAALLRELRARGVPVYVNSATPQKALEAAVAARGWTRFVDGVLGANLETGSDKIEHLRLLAEKCQTRDIVHVGDGRNDADAAKRFGCAFVGVRLAPSPEDDTRLFLATVDDARGAAAALRPHLVPSCRICDKNWGVALPFGGALWESERWVLCHASAPVPVAGWLVLHSRRHVAAPADFDDLEAQEFGPVLRRIQAALLAATSALRIYCCAMAETSPHFHMHLVPRQPDAATPGFALFGLQQAAKRDPANFAVSEAAVLRVTDVLRGALRDSPPPVRDDDDDFHRSSRTPP